MWSSLFAPTTPLPPRAQSTSSRRGYAPAHAHAQSPVKGQIQGQEALQKAFDFSTPGAGEAAQTNGSDSPSTPQPSDDLGAAFTGPGLAGTVFALDPDHFDTNV